MYIFTFGPPVGLENTNVLYNVGLSLLRVSRLFGKANCAKYKRSEHRVARFPRRSKLREMLAPIFRHPWRGWGSTQESSAKTTRYLSNSIQYCTSLALDSRRRSIPVACPSGIQPLPGSRLSLLRHLLHPSTTREEQVHLYLERCYFDDDVCGSETMHAWYAYLTIWYNFHAEADKHQDGLSMFMPAGFVARNLRMQYVFLIFEFFSIDNLYEEGVDANMSIPNSRQNTLLMIVTRF